MYFSKVEFRKFESSLLNIFIIKGIYGRTQIDWVQRMTARFEDRQGYIPVYTHTEIIDVLHECNGFRANYEILYELSMKTQ